MYLQILGSGTILSGTERTCSGYYLTDKNKQILLDCGPGIIKNMDKMGIKAESLDVVFISHFHLDHCSDLFPLLMRRYLISKKLNPKLTVAGPKGLRTLYSSLAEVHGDWISDYPPRIVELSGDDNFASFSLKTVPNGHKDNSISFLFNVGQKRFFYSSDMAFQNSIAVFAKEADLAVIECSHRDENPVEGHMTPTTAARLINAAQFKHTVVTHMYPANDGDDLLQRIQKHTRLPVEIGYDFMELNI